MATRRILFVDDEAALLDGVRRLLHRQYDLAFARSADEAIEILGRDGPFAVICADMRMPGRSGVELLGEVAERWPDTVRMMLSGNADQGTAVEAINRGRIFSFLNKPATRETLTAALDAALRLHALSQAEKELLERTLAGTIQTLVEILSAALPDQFGRAQRVREFLRRHGKALGGHGWRLDMAAMLAPIGWATLPPELADKIRHGISLTAEEDRVVRGVGEISGRLIANIPRLESVGEVVRYAGKGQDGSGYPDDDVKGDALPLDSRILRLATAVVETAGDGAPAEATLDRLRARSAEFDSGLMAKLRVELARVAAAASVPAAVVLAEVEVGRVELLVVGDQLLGDLLLEDGTLALARDTVVTALLVEKLANLARIRKLQLPIRVRRRVEAPAAAGRAAA